MADEIRIQVNYTVTAPTGEVFQDALYFTPAEYKNSTDAQVEAMKQERFAAWYAVITAPTPSKPPLPDDSDEPAAIQQE